MLGIPIGAVMTGRRRALKLSQLIETPVRSAVAHLHGCRALRSSSWKVRRYELAGSQSAYLLRQQGTVDAYAGREPSCLLGLPGSPTAVPTDTG
jgi:hypothetical protein